ncbi:hypothetical protein BDV18DRAFT_102423 [Aspergillus unguis]
MVVNYLADWAFGHYRSVPYPEENLGTLCGIIPINMPHGIDQHTLGFSRPGSYLDNCWMSRIWEYLPVDGTVYPHVIPITLQTSHGMNGSITQGELAVIIRAMRNRSRQPAVFDEEADPDDLDKWPVSIDAMDEEALLFKNEKRFPVLMASILHPQQGRIIYACLHGAQLAIRLSKLYNFRNRKSAPLELFACMLLSHPLNET